jgi:hypothetical protein
MKKILILISAIALSSTVIAQKGSWYIGGVAGYGSSTSKDANDKKDVTTSWAFGPEVGTFLKDDIQLGIALGLDGSSSKFEGTEYAKTSSLSPTLYARKFFKITDNLSSFAGLYLNYISGTDTQTGYADEKVETKKTGFGGSIGIGVAYALSPRFTAVGQYGLIGYHSVNNKVAGDDAGTDSGFEIGVNTVGSSSFGQGNGSGSVFNVGIYYTISTGAAK